MIENVLKIGGGSDVAVARSARTERARAPAAESPLVPSLPETPPPEVLDALAAAQRVIRELERAQLSLRFQVDDVEVGWRVRVEVRDAEGRLVREIPPSRLGAVLAGEGIRGLVGAGGERG